MSEKILLIGPLKDFSGYAAAARNYASALDLAGANIATRDLRYDGGNYTRTAREEEMSFKPVYDTKIVMQQTTPNEMEYRPGLFNVGVFCWETDKIPTEWVNSLNKMQLVLVPCYENLIAARKSGVCTPIEVVPYSCDTSRFNKPVEPYFINGAADYFKFLAVCQLSKKKGVDALLKAYYAEFEAHEKVLLILKVYIGPNDSQNERNKILNLIQASKEVCRLKSYPHVNLIHSVMSDDEIDRLYASANCYVLPSRGEGWGVPHFDALGWGLPAIATKGTGPEEFITEKCGWLVNSNKSPVIDMPHPHDFLYTAKENWCEPHSDSLQAAMREAINLRGTGYTETPQWTMMRTEAKNRATQFDNKIIGPQLLDTIMKYYKMWKA